MNNFEDVKSLIESANTIVLATHTHADGDAIGSIGAMYHLLKEMKKKVYMLLPELESTYSFLPNIQDKVESIGIDLYDLLICLDCSSQDRLNITTQDLKKAKSVLVIDHHKNNILEANVKFVDETAPANCEIIYDIVKYMGHNISKNIAEYIYMGIMTDTGSFNYERTSSKTHKIAGEMIDIGADYVKICKILNHTYSETKMKLVSMLISNMESYMDGKLRVGVIDNKIIEKFDAKEPDLENLVNYLRGIENTIVSVYMRALDDTNFKVSVRAEEPVDAALLCANFGGGGHKRAAGFVTSNVQDTKIKLIQILERLLESESNRNT